MERINNDEAIRYLLMKEWLSEFKIIDGINTHKDGLGYEDWCRARGFVEEWKIVK